MRILKILASILVVGVLLTGVIGCGSDEATEEAGTYTTTAELGNLVVNISAAGNLAFSQTEDLAIDLFYQQGTVEEVLVEEGDSVTEGQELVKLDTGEWNDHLALLEDALISANRTLTTRQDSLYEAERQVKAKKSALADAERLVTTRQFAVRQAELDVQSANYTLNHIDEVSELQERLDNAAFAIQFANEVLSNKYAGIVVADFSKWQQMKNDAQEEYDAIEEDLNNLLNDIGLTQYANNTQLALSIAQKQLQIEQTNMQLEDAKRAVEDAGVSVDDAEYAVTQAEQAVDDARLNVEDAAQAVDEARENLEEAQVLSPVITAPFDGFITKVNVEGGDEVLKGTVAVQMADPDKFEAEILVSEADILQVQVGTLAMVTADAITGISYPAEVTHISPTATISSGVVNYTVKVVLSDLEDIAQNMQSRFDAAQSDNATGGQFSPPEGSANLTGGGQFPQGSFGQMSGGITATDYDLREGMSVTVNLIVSSETNVLLVPYIAVTTTGGQSYVEVQLENGETEQRAVTTGSTNYSFIAITDGLSEGETVVVPEGTVTSSGSSFGGFPGGFMFGGGRP